MSPAALMSRRGKPGAAVWTPASIAGLNVWYDATKLALADGASVTAVADQSGNGRDVASVTGTVTYRSAGINSHPAIDFATSITTPSNYFVLPSSAFTGCGPQGSMFIVWVQNASTGNNGPFNLDGVVSCYLAHSNGNGYLQGFTAARRTISSWPTPGTPQVLSLLSGSATFNAYVNGASVFSDTTANSAPTFANYQLGTGANNQWNAKMGEFLIYNSSLGTSDRQAVESYLRTKWGTP